jgi:hypothetical protein
MGPCDEALALARWLLSQQPNPNVDEIELAYELMGHGQRFLEQKKAES